MICNDFEYCAKVDDWIEQKILPNMHHWLGDPELPIRGLLASLKEEGLLIAGWPDPWGDGCIDKQIYLHYALARQPVGGIGLSLVSHLDIGARAVLEKGTEQQKALWLPKAISGESLFSLAMTEPNAGSDLQSIEFTATPDGDGWLLTGTKRGITNLPIADVSVVLARTRPDRTPFAYTLFLLPLQTNGVLRDAPLPSLGYPGCLGGMEVTEARLGQDSVLGAVGGGLMLLMQHLQTERLFVSARMAGLAEYILAEFYQGNQTNTAHLVTQYHAYLAYVEACVRNYSAGTFTAKDSASLKFMGSQLLQSILSEIVPKIELEDAFNGQLLSRCRDEAMGLSLAGGSREIMLNIIGGFLSPA